jgi:type II secretory pathway component PulF
VVLAVDRGRFASAMALMLKSALPIDEAMSRTAVLMKNSRLAEQIEVCRQDMAAGTSFAKALGTSGLLSPLQAGLLSAGARSGAMDEAMDEVALRSAEEADEAVSRLLGRLGFFLVFLLCLSVGLILLSVMLPLIGVLTALG